MNEQDRNEIRLVVDEICKSTCNNKHEFFENKYPEFKKRYPGLFDMVCAGKLKSANLEFMLAMLTKMDKEKMTQYDASAQVGTMLYEEYVKPHLTG